MKPITIDWSEWMKGESISDDAPTGGFSPSSYGLNLTKSRGLLYFSESPTDRSGAVLTGNILASAYDKNFLGNDSYHLDDGGAFYTLSGATLTKRQTVTADTFTLGTTDMLQFQGNTYATTQQRIVQLTGSNLAAVDSSWWTALNANYRHPLERVEDTMYIGDLNLVHSWDGTTSTSGAITLPTDVNITSLRKHPDGINLLAFCGLTANYSHANGQGGRIYVIDTRIKRWVREIEIDTQVEGSKLVGGTVFCSYGQNIGYFNGNGITFLKKLTTSATTYSQCMTDWEGNFMVRDGLTVLAYGDLGLGKRVWWRPIINQQNSQNINNICYKGSDTMLVGFSNGAGGGYLMETNLANNGLIGKLYGNRTIMPVQCKMRRIELLHTPVTGTYVTLVKNKDETDTENIIVSTNPGFVSEQWKSKYRVEMDYAIDVYQLTLETSNGSPGYRFLRMFYEPVEQ